MDRSEARKLLQRWAVIDLEIEDAEKAYKAKCDEIDMVASIPSPVQSLSPMPHDKNVSRTTERVALRRIEIAESYRDELNRLNEAVINAMRFKHKISECLLICTPDEEEVVTGRYKYRMSMPVVAKKLCIGVATGWRYEQNVLDTICDTWTEV